jgi:hypothetical protein
VEIIGGDKGIPAELEHASSPSQQRRAKSDSLQITVVDDLLLWLANLKLFASQLTDWC